MTDVKLTYETQRPDSDGVTLRPRIISHRDITEIEHDWYGVTVHYETSGGSHVKFHCKSIEYLE